MKEGILRGDTEDLDSSRCSQTDFLSESSLSCSVERCTRAKTLPLHLAAGEIREGGRHERSGGLSLHRFASWMMELGGSCLGQRSSSWLRRSHSLPQRATKETKPFARQPARCSLIPISRQMTLSRRALDRALSQFFLDCRIRDTDLDKRSKTYGRGRLSSKPDGYFPDPGHYSNGTVVGVVCDPTGERHREAVSFLRRDGLKLQESLSNTECMSYQPHYPSQRAGSRSR